MAARPQSISLAFQSEPLPSSFRPHGKYTGQFIVHMCIYVYIHIQVQVHVCTVYICVDIVFIYFDRIPVIFLRFATVMHDFSACGGPFEAGLRSFAGLRQNWSWLLSHLANLILGAARVSANWVTTGWLPGDFRVTAGWLPSLKGPTIYKLSNNLSANSIVPTLCFALRETRFRNRSLTKVLCNLVSKLCTSMHRFFPRVVFVASNLWLGTCMPECNVPKYSFGDCTVMKSNVKHMRMFN